MNFGPMRAEAGPEEPSCLPASRAAKDRIPVSEGSYLRKGRAMEGLGALGFWLGLGIFLAGGAIAGALKERVKEREKQATLRALLEGEGEVTPEVLAYLREK